MMLFIQDAAVYVDNNIMRTVWQKVQTISGVFCLMMYAFSLLYASKLILEAVREHEKTSAREFSELKKFASSASALGWTSQSFKDDMQIAVSAAKNIQAFILSKSGTYSVAVQKKNGIIEWHGDKPYFTKDFLNPLRIMGADNIQIEGAEGVQTSAAATYIDFFDLFFILRKALFIILFATILAFSMLIAAYSFDIDRKAAQIAQYLGETGDDDDEPYEADTAETVALKKKLYSADAFDTIDDKRPFVEFLEKELEKNEENDEDIALIAAISPHIHYGDIAFATACSRSFKEGSSLYQREGQGVYVIAPRTNVDEAFEAAKQFHRELTQNPARRKTRVLTIGISSRAGRSVHPERLISETDRALGKAGEDPKSPIVAFKVDLEKYRSFIERKGDEFSR